MSHIRIVVSFTDSGFGRKARNPISFGSASESRYKHKDRRATSQIRPAKRVRFNITSFTLITNLHYEVNFAGCKRYTDLFTAGDWVIQRRNIPGKYLRFPMIPTTLGDTSFLFESLVLFRPRWSRTIQMTYMQNYKFAHYSERAKVLARGEIDPRNGGHVLN